jgi:hypothetical protein
MKQFATELEQSSSPEQKLLCPMTSQIPVAPLNYKEQQQQQKKEFSLSKEKKRPISAKITVKPYCVQRPSTSSGIVTTVKCTSAKEEKQRETNKSRPQSSPANATTTMAEMDGWQTRLKDLEVKKMKGKTIRINIKLAGFAQN